MRPFASALRRIARSSSLPRLAPVRRRACRRHSSVTAGVIVLQPRRVAARAIARRIAAEQGWTLGPRSRVARPLRAPVRPRDPPAGRHGRHPHRAPAAGSAALRLSRRSCSTSSTSAASTPTSGLALARQAWRARDDLRLVVMSATLDAGAGVRVPRRLPVGRRAGRAHPLSIEYRRWRHGRRRSTWPALADVRPDPLLPAGRAGDPPSATGRARQQPLAPRS